MNPDRNDPVPRGAMPAGDLDALRARLDELARENQELRALMLRGSSNPPAAESWTNEVDARVGLSRGELRRRRLRGRVVAALLLGLGIGVGISTVRLISREVFPEPAESGLTFEMTDEYPRGITIIRRPLGITGEMTVDTIFGGPPPVAVHGTHPVPAPAPVPMPRPVPPGATAAPPTPAPTPVAPR